jgi:hypothetical protein
LQQHVGAGDQLLELRASFLGRKVDDDGLLAAVEPDEIAALALGGGIIAAREIALGAFDPVAPASARREEQNGAATACSTARTVIPSSGSIFVSLVLAHVLYRRTA